MSEDITEGLHERHADSIPFTVDDLFTVEGVPRKSRSEAREQKGLTTVYHITESSRLKYIAQYGLYLELGVPTLTEDMIMSGFGSVGVEGNVALAFKTHEKDLRSEEFGMGRALSLTEKAKVEEVDPQLLKELQDEADRTDNRFRKNSLLYTKSQLERLSRSEKGIAWLPPDKIDWDETMRASAIHNLRTRANAADTIASKGRGAFEPWYGDLLQIRKQIAAS